jgi:hypothetical protein
MSLPLPAALSCSLPLIITPPSNSSMSRWYSSTRPSLEDAAPKKKQDPVNKQIAQEFGRRKAAYNRQVGQLRKEYMDEYVQYKAEDDAAREAQVAEITRKRLERQRVKNVRSAENASRQVELRRQVHLAFQDHLRVQQEKRDEKKTLFSRARQMIVDELEQEAPLWLTTPEEVDATFTPEAEQLLWARPNGILGASNPSLDSHYWQYECHTWRVEKTYKTQRDILLEQFEEESYNKANIDPSFWTPERLEEREELERKAKLRAMVRWEGRKALMLRQKEYLDEASVVEEGDAPRPVPVPSLGVLANVRAQEKEGSEILFKDPTKFFVFDRSSAARDESTKFDAGEDVGYAGPALGAPIELVDPLRTGAPQGRVFPLAIGKLPKPDTRTEKEKKREEREQKLWAAAQAQARSDQDEIDMAADEDMELGEPLNYDANADWDSDDEDWVKGLDPDRDSDIIGIPKELRYKEEDIDWVIEKLEGKAKQIQSHIRNSYNMMQQELKARKERRDKEQQALAKKGEEQVEQSIDEEDTPILDESSSDQLRAAGVDVQQLESLVSSLSQEQLIALFTMGVESLGSQDINKTVSPEEIVSAMEKIPGLTEEQIASIVQLETMLQQTESDSGSKTKRQEVKEEDDR